MSKKFRVGIVGCGNIFPMHAYPVNELDCCELVAECDIRSLMCYTVVHRTTCTPSLQSMRWSTV